MSQDLDGELSPRRKAVLKAHIAGCVSCQEAERLWREVGDQFRAQELPVSQSPDAAWADVRRAIRNTEPDVSVEEVGPVWGRRMVWAMAAIAIVAVGVLSLYLSVKPGGIHPVSVAESGGTTVEWVETDLPGATPMVYEDEETGWTVIWVVEADREENGHAGS